MGMMSGMEAVVDSGPFLALRAALDGTYIVFLIAGYLRPHSVKGTRNRYFYASIQRITAWPAFAFIVVSAARAIHLDFSRAILGAILLPMAAQAWWYLYSKMRVDDDDDVVKRWKKRLRQAARNVADALTPSPQLAPIPTR